MDEVKTAQREVRPFNLDRFEVTVGRFLTFLVAYDTARFPKQEAGGTPSLPGSGWQREWSTNPKLMAPNVSSLMIGMSECGSILLDADNAKKPITCVNWYLALAFCIWDGGRLPTETEWSFAALGGDEKRAYPWSSAPFDAVVDSEHACYKAQTRPCTGLTPVGSYPLGRGKWFTRDLAGNAVEWTLDEWHKDLGQAACARDGSPDRAAPDDDCAASGDETLRVARGGSYTQLSRYLLNASRSYSVAPKRGADTGFRCVRDIQ